VNFKYPSREKAVFNGLSFKVEAGQKVGLVGSSGCGKSTIMQLVLRFYEINQGLIMIDGRDIKNYDLYHLRQSFGIVTQ
jgi:ABC-type multidrug transport system fused ATPase/permease subunit